MTTAQQDAPSAPQRDLSTAELQQAAQTWVLEYKARNKGAEPTGEKVGELFGMKERWGRNQIAAVRSTSGTRAGTAPARHSGTGGTARPTVAEAVAARAGAPEAVRVDIAAPAAARPAERAAAPAPARTAAQSPARPPSAPAPAGTQSARDSGTAAARQTGTSSGTGGWLRQLLAGTKTRQAAGGGNPVSVWVRGITIAAVSVVAVVAAIVSYVHMHELAEKSGEGWRAVLIPLSVDGLLVAASMVMLVRRQANEKVGLLPWVGVALGLIASLGANVLSVGEVSWANLVRIIVSAWPPVALALSVEFLLIVTGGRHRKASS